MYSFKTYTRLEEEPFSLLNENKPTTLGAKAGTSVGDKAHADYIKPNLGKHGVAINPKTKKPLRWAGNKEHMPHDSEVHIHGHKIHKGIHHLHVSHSGKHEDAKWVPQSHIRKGHSQESVSNRGHKYEEHVQKQLNRAGLGTNWTQTKTGEVKSAGSASNRPDAAARNDRVKKSHRSGKILHVRGVKAKEIIKIEVKNLLHPKGVKNTDFHHIKEDVSYLFEAAGKKEAKPAKADFGKVTAEMHQGKWRIAPASHKRNPHFAKRMEKSGVLEKLQSIHPHPEGAEIKHPNKIATAVKHIVPDPNSVHHFATDSKRKADGTLGAHVLHVGSTPDTPARKKKPGQKGSTYMLGDRDFTGMGLSKLRSEHGSVLTARQDSNTGHHIASDGKKRVKRMVITAGANGPVDPAKHDIIDHPGDREAFAKKMLDK